MKNIHDFYDFSSKLSSMTIRAHASEIDKIPDPLGEKFADHERLIVGIYGLLDFPILFKQRQEKKWDDMLNTEWPSLYLISGKMKTILEENKLTGWKTFSIKFLDKKDNEIFGYYGFSITGRCAPIDYSKSEIIQKKTLENGPVWNYYRGGHINLDKWDESDFFLPQGTTNIMVTSKAADTLKNHKISNVYLRNLADIELDESTVKIAEENKLRVSFW